MNAICLDIFKAVHEGKWLSIEYKNGQDEITRYWIGIKSIDPQNRTLFVEGLHLAKYTVMDLKIFIDSIQSSAIIDGSYFETDVRLLNDIKLCPSKYLSLFDRVANLKILSYLENCSRLDTTPYKTEYALIDHLDGDWQEEYRLNAAQFQEIVTNFQYRAKKKNDFLASRKIKQLALNVLSVNTRQGLYVLAYRKLRLDVRAHTLRQDDEIEICTEFTVNGNKQSIRQFLDADDMPYLIAAGRDVILDLHSEYEAIHKMYEEDEVTIPIKAFFGNLLRQVDRRKDQYDRQHDRYCFFQREDRSFCVLQQSSYRWCLREAPGKRRSHPKIDRYKPSSYLSDRAAGRTDGGGTRENFTDRGNHGCRQQ